MSGKTYISGVYYIHVDVRNSCLSSAKHYGKVIHCPLTKGDPNNEVIDIYAPPKLHLLMDVVNTLYNHLLHVWPQAVIWPKNVTLKGMPCTAEHLMIILGNY